MLEPSELRDVFEGERYGSIINIYNLGFLKTYEFSQKNETLSISSSLLILFCASVMST